MAPIGTTPASPGHYRTVIGQRQAMKLPGSDGCTLFNSSGTVHWPKSKPPPHPHAMTVSSFVKARLWYSPAAMAVTPLNLYGTVHWPTLNNKFFYPRSPRPRPCRHFLTPNWHIERRRWLSHHATRPEPCFRRMYYLPKLPLLHLSMPGYEMSWRQWLLLRSTSLELCIFRNWDHHCIPRSPPSLVRTKRLHPPAPAQPVQRAKTPRSSNLQGSPIETFYFNNVFLPSWVGDCPEASSYIPFLQQH